MQQNVLPVYQRKKRPSRQRGVIASKLSASRNKEGENNKTRLPNTKYRFFKSRNKEGNDNARPPLKLNNSRRTIAGWKAGGSIGGGNAAAGARARQKQGGGGGSAVKKGGSSFNGKVAPNQVNNIGSEPSLEMVLLLPGTLYR